MAALRGRSGGSYDSGAADQALGWALVQWIQLKDIQIWRLVVAHVRMGLVGWSMGSTSLIDWLAGLFLFFID